LLFHIPVFPFPLFFGEKTGNYDIKKQWIKQPVPAKKTQIFPLSGQKNTNFFPYRDKKHKFFPYRDRKMQFFPYRLSGQKHKFKQQIVKAVARVQALLIAVP
jgi:hypothetical protein